MSYNWDEEIFKARGVELTGTYLIEQTKLIRAKCLRATGINYAYIPRLGGHGADWKKTLEQEEGYENHLAYLQIMKNTTAKNLLRPRATAIFPLLVDAGLPPAGEYHDQFTALVNDSSTPFHARCKVQPVMEAFGVEVPPAHKAYPSQAVFDEKVSWHRNNTWEGLACQDIADMQANIEANVYGDAAKMKRVQEFVIQSKKGTGKGNLEMMLEMFREGKRCACYRCKDIPEDVLKYIIFLYHLNHVGQDGRDIKQLFGGKHPAQLSYKELLKQKHVLELVCPERHAELDLNKLSIIASLAPDDSPPDGVDPSTYLYSKPKIIRHNLVANNNASWNGGIAVIGGASINREVAATVHNHHPTRGKKMLVVGFANGEVLELDTSKSLHMCKLILSARESDVVVGEIADGRVSSPDEFMLKAIREMTVTTTSTAINHDLHHRLENNADRLDNLLGIERHYTITADHYVVNIEHMPRLAAAMEAGNNNQLYPPVRVSSNDIVTLLSFVFIFIISHTCIASFSLHLLISLPQWYDPCLV